MGQIIKSVDICVSVDTPTVNFSTNLEYGLPGTVLLQQCLSQIIKYQYFAMLGLSIPKHFTNPMILALNFVDPGIYFAM